MLRGRVITGIADPAIFDQSRGESVADMQEKSPNFLHWRPGDHTRLAGKMQFHYRLHFDEEGRPMLQVFHTLCTTKATWRTSTPGRRIISTTSAAMC